MVVGWALIGGSVTTNSARSTPLPLPFTVNGTDRSCANCPSAISVSDQQSNIGSTVGAPICGAHSKPLLNPVGSKQVQKRQLEHHAKGCGQFGKSFQGFRPGAFTTPFEFELALPKPNNKVDDPDDRIKVANCTSCTNFVPSAFVKGKFGYDAPLCLAKGALLLEDRLDRYPLGCEDNERWSGSSNLPNLDGVMLFPEHESTFGVIDPAKQAKRHREVKPQEWLSDAPVTDEHARRGIRAWRRIDDPDEYAEPCFLPVYDLDFFGDRARLVPLQGSKEHPELFTDYGGFVWQIVVAWTKMSMTPILWGIPGVGKTEVLRYTAYLMGAPFTRISITGSTELDDIAGKMMYHPEKGTYFHQGRFTAAYCLPGVICLDEPNTGQESVWQFTRPVFDNSKQLVIDTSDDPVPVNQHEDCHIALAANPAWDARNVGTNEIGDADARRLLHVNVGMPPESIEREIITRWCLTLDNYDPAPILTDLMKVAKDIREMAANSSINVTWGIASQVKVARAMRHFQPKKAFEIAILNYLDPDARRQVQESVNSYYK